MKGTIVMQKMAMKFLMSNALPRLIHTSPLMTHFVHHFCNCTTQECIKIHSLDTDRVDHANPTCISHLQVPNIISKRMCIILNSHQFTEDPCNTTCSSKCPC